MVPRRRSEYGSKYVDRLERAVMWAYDIPDAQHYLPHELHNRDMIPPPYRLERGVNYIQLLSETCGYGSSYEYDETILLYLFADEEPLGMPWEFNQREEIERALFHRHVTAKYSTAHEYLASIHERIQSAGGYWKNLPTRSRYLVKVVSRYWNAKVDHAVPAQKGN